MEPSTQEVPTKKDEIRKLQPTLFIGLGGTGMEVALRIRRRILHAGWGGDGSVRVASLEEFPVAEFLHFDLDQGALLEEGRSANNDPLASLVKLSDEDRVVKSLDLLKYTRSEDDLLKYPNIAAWFPFTAEKIRSLKINPSKGAGQMRAVSRLYFFDNYRQTRDAIAQKLDHLKANRTNRTQLDHLKLELDNDRVRIVVIGSIAGGTGSGSFLDMGWLTQLLAEKAFGGANYDVQFVLFTPRGYAKADKDQVGANGYAALMELETCMRQYPEYVGTWLMDEGKPVLNLTPYTDVYLIETANMGHHALEDVKEVYEMVADVLFEDFANADFADKKRSIAVNQQKHKALSYHPPIPEEYGELKLGYSMGYSSFGQSILDTQYTQQLDEQEYQCCAAMLEAFFCVSRHADNSLKATDKERDEFLKQHLKLVFNTFKDFPDFGNFNDERKKLCESLQENHLTETMLKDEHGGIEDAILQKVNSVVEGIKADESNITDWPRLLLEQIPALEKDVIRNQDTKAETSEDRVTRRAEQVLTEKQEIATSKLYDYLDNQEYGGLEFVISLIDLLKTEFTNSSTGWAKLLLSNAERYHSIRDALKTHQIQATMDNIATAVESGFIKRPDSTKAKTYMDQLKNDLGAYLRFHVRGVAAKNGAKVLTNLSSYLGERAGVDDKGNVTFTGLMGEFQAGRREVLSVSEEIRTMTQRIEDSVAKRHANYILLPVEAVEYVLPDGKTLREWANEAFKDFGGSKVIFPMLKKQDGKDKLIARLRNKAVTEQVRLVANASRWNDPLVSKLNSLQDERKRHFSELLRAAMPWMDANFADVPLKAQKFKCLLGVGKISEWEPFLEDLKASLPANMGITAEQFQLCETGIPGRAVCYCELSGVPLTVLRGLENWRVNYRQVGKEWPLHTNIDPTLFVHPLVPLSQELKDRAADFRLFLLAVMLRILVRNQRKTIPPGQYQFDFGHGDRRDFGNERAFRMNGLPPEYRPIIDQAVKNVIDTFDAMQIKALSELTNFIARETYKPKMLKDDTGKDYPVPGFSHASALRLSSELSQMAIQRGLTAERAKIMERHLIDWDDITSLDSWCEVIQGSADDAYRWEVAEPDDQMPDRSKRRVRKEFFETGWLNKIIEPVSSSPVVSAQHLEQPPPLGIWWVALNGQKNGPHDENGFKALIDNGKINLETKVWKKGMAGWTQAQQVTELAGLFDGPPPLDDEPPPID